MTFNFGFLDITWISEDYEGGCMGFLLGCQPLGPGRFVIAVEAFPIPCPI